MSEVILYIAVSLDGFIAPPNGSVDWLDEKRFQDGVGEDEDFGYKTFLKNVGLIVMGRKSYDQILDFGEWPYPEKNTKVFTHRIPLENPHYVEFVEGNVVKHLKQWRGSCSKNIWLLGGGELNTLFRQKSLIDRYIITLIPTFLGSGRRLFNEHLPMERLTLRSHQSWENGFVHLEYQ